MIPEYKQAKNFLGPGRYLCMQYARGALKPSVYYKEGSSQWLLSRCVEIPLEKSGVVAEFWRALFIVSTRNGKERENALKLRHKTGYGGRVTITGVYWLRLPIELAESISPDACIGCGVVSLLELMLYWDVGEQLVQKVKSFNKHRYTKFVW